MFTLLLVCSSPMDGRTDSFSPSILPPPQSSSFWGTSTAINLSGTQEVLPTTCGEEVFYWVISSDLLLLNDPDIPTLLYRSSGSCSSPEISFVPFLFALSCFWEVLQDLGSDHLTILLPVPLSPIFCPNKSPPFLQLSKSSLG